MQFLACLCSVLMQITKKKHVMKPKVKYLYIYIKKKRKKNVHSVLESREGITSVMEEEDRNLYVLY